MNTVVARPLRDGGGRLSGAALGSPSAPPEEEGNDGATVHASDPRDSSAAVGAETAPSGGDPEHGAQRRGPVYETLRRAREAGLDWAGIEGMTDDALEAALYRRPAVAGPRGTRPQPDCVYLHTERRKPGVTLELLHLEYLERHPDGYRYTQFCDIYRRWPGRRRLTMRQVHRAGEKGVVDYAGKTPCLTDPATGERIPVELFVMALGASSYTSAEATATQHLPGWIASHTRAFPF